MINRLKTSTCLCLMTASAGSAAAQVLPAQSAVSRQNGTLTEIIVTAQKRSQSINDVGLTITAVSGAMLQSKGVESVYDLIRVVPGLSVANPGNGAAPIYTLRGVGFNTPNFGSTPTVSVYLDEVSLPYPAMTQGVLLDLARVEVYKGPQGTLYGQNSTAGAVNYIAAGPTSRLTGGFSSSYGSYNWWDIKGYISGPVSDSVKMRLAVSQAGGDGWQSSYTRDAHLGARDKTAVRFLGYWTPNSDLSVKLAMNYWRDNSDSQALQFEKYVPLLPPGLPAVANYPTAPSNDRAADWDPNTRYKLGQRFLQPSLRADWKIGYGLTLTSLSTYSDYRANSLLEVDGTALPVQNLNQFGFIHDFNQELRLAGATGALRWVAGGSYEHNRINEDDNPFIPDLSNIQNVAGSGFSITHSIIQSRQQTDAKAAFVNAEYTVNKQLSVVAGGRYTQTDLAFSGCSQDENNPIPNYPVPGVTSSTRGVFNYLYGLLTGNVGANPVQPGACATLDNIPRNGAPPTFLPTNSAQVLSEDNFSWNTTVNYKPIRNILLYARVAQGYKSGVYPTLGASFSIQYTPAKQEGLLAYEAGFKATLLDQTLQLDGAGFYYDYKNKQLANFVFDPIFGPLTATVNVPKSRVDGAELSAAWAPLASVRINAAVTYIDTKITRFTGFDENGVLQDFSGAQFSLAPHWSGTADATYIWPLSSSLTASLGGGVTIRSKTTGIIQISDDPDYVIPGYALFDAHAGIESAAGWTLEGWAKNLTNAYYYTSVNRISDAIVRSAGLPAMYGVTFGYTF